MARAAEDGECPVGEEGVGAASLLSLCLMVAGDNTRVSVLASPRDCREPPPWLIASNGLGMGPLGTWTQPPPVTEPSGTA